MTEPEGTDEDQGSQRLAEVKKVEFGSPPTCTVTLADGHTYTVHGLIANKWQLCVTALLRYEAFRQCDEGEELIDKLKEALR